ncbi:hypothetical protein TEK04_05430 [Klenkia sp. LSe6-5]|uniref:Uncharacterized protein n=1 Tax=Klenkia sesuvii TaxID=3103137 RepID=A0ABU8DR51_9ACTN
MRQQENSSARTDLELEHESGATAQIRLERCVAGRLESAYPASVRDVEIRVVALSDGGLLTAVLEGVVRAVRSAEPACRRIIYGAPRGQVGAVAASEQAGFRYVVDVDLVDAELSLLVSEPEWVSVADEAADAVPGS